MPLSSIRSAVLALVAVTSACSGKADPGKGGGLLTSADVAGDWCGTPNNPGCGGDEALWLQLHVAGEAITGQMCENPGRDCHPLTSVTLDSRDHLLFSYSFGGGTVLVPRQVGVDSGPPQTVSDPGHRVDGDMAVNGDKMTGTIFATKCDCTIPQRFYRH